LLLTAEKICTDGKSVFTICHPSPSFKAKHHFAHEQ
jgi:hypothetical protein